MVAQRGGYVNRKRTNRPGPQTIWLGLQRTTLLNLARYAAVDHAPTILMCPPPYFGIDYEINPWMDRRRPCDDELVAGQWQNLCSLLEAAGATIECLPPVAGLPDLVFTANAALIWRHTAILSRFRHYQRRPEEVHFQRWLEAWGFRIHRLPTPMYFEGAGDAMFLDDTLFAGYRLRSEAVALQRVGQLLGRRVIPLELVDNRYYHLDTCLCPLAAGMAVYYPPAFDDYGRKVLQQRIDDLIPVEPDEARQFACNAVVLNRTVITNVGCPKLHRQLQARGFTTHATPLGEFVKAGGSAKCLTLRLDGEDLAPWKAGPVERLSHEKW